MNRTGRFVILTTVLLVLATSPLVGRSEQGNPQTAASGIATASAELARQEVGAETRPGVDESESGAEATQAGGDLVDRAVDVVSDQLDEAGLRGEYALEVAYKPMQLTVYCRSDKLDSAIIAAASSAAAPVAVDIVRPRFDVSDLVSEASRLIELRDVVTARPSDNYSSVLVGVAPADVARVERVPPSSRFPIRIEESASLAHAARHNDTAPAYGGALIKSDADKVCSVGINVTYEGKKGFTTAAHCPGHYWYGHSGNYLGQADPGAVSTPNDI